MERSLKIDAHVQNVASCVVGSGNYISPWYALWQDPARIQKFPELHSYANNDNISLPPCSTHLNLPATTRPSLQSGI